MPATNRSARPVTPRQTKRPETNTATAPRPEHFDRADASALAELRLAGAVTGARSRKISVRVDPGILRAAGERLGLTNTSDLVNASLSLAAAPDRFKAWWAETRETLPDDFELAV